MTEIFKVHKKAEAVIESCTNLTHLDGAEIYIRRMFKIYTEKEFKKYFVKSEKKAVKDFRRAMKDELLKKLTLKKQSLQSRLK